MDCEYEKNVFDIRAEDGEFRQNSSVHSADDMTLLCLERQYGLLVIVLA